MDPLNLLFMDDFIVTSIWISSHYNSFLGCVLTKMYLFYRLMFVNDYCYYLNLIIIIHIYMYDGLLVI